MGVPVVAYSAFRCPGGVGEVWWRGEGDLGFRFPLIAASEVEVIIREYSGPEEDSTGSGEPLGCYPYVMDQEPTFIYMAVCHRCVVTAPLS